jgi:hypothetical protein
MDNVLIVVEDLEAAKAHVAELGMELEREMQVEGPWVDSTVGLSDVRADITRMRTPDGHGRVELTKLHTSPALAQRSACRTPARTRCRRIEAAYAQVAKQQRDESFAGELRGLRRLRRDLRPVDMRDEAVGLGADRHQRRDGICLRLLDKGDEITDKLRPRRFIGAS